MGDFAPYWQMLSSDCFSGGWVNAPSATRTLCRRTQTISPEEHRRAAKVTVTPDVQIIGTRDAARIAWRPKSINLRPVATYADLSRKVVLLTGGANGIGAATVRALAAQGAQVEFCDIDKTAGQRLERELDSCAFAHLDLAREARVARWIATAARRHGRIDVVVNNAAIDPRIPLERLTTEQLDRLLAINLRALYWTTREAVPHMLSGSIINFSSITFHTAPAKMSAYVGSKGAVIGATRSLARELGPRRIRVNVVSPGWIMTERQLREFVDAKTKRLIKSAQCIPELLQPEDIAEVVLFLASDASRAITGQEILADRGWSHS